MLCVRVPSYCMRVTYDLHVECMPAVQACDLHCMSFTLLCHIPDVVILDVSEVIHMSNANNPTNHDSSTKLESVHKHFCHECFLCSLRKHRHNLESAPALLWQECNKQSHLKISLCYSSEKAVKQIVLTICTAAETRHAHWHLDIQTSSEQV